MFFRFSLVVLWCLWMLVSSAAPMGGVRRELDAEPLRVEEFSRELGERDCWRHCIREPEVEPLRVEEFARELEERDFLSA